MGREIIVGLKKEMDVADLKHMAEAAEANANMSAWRAKSRRVHPPEYYIGRLDAIEEIASRLGVDLFRKEFE